MFLHPSFEITLNTPRALGQPHLKRDVRGKLMGFLDSLATAINDIADASVRARENHFEYEEKQTLLDARDILRRHNKTVAADEIDKVIAISEGRSYTGTTSRPTTPATTGYEMAKDIERALTNSGNFRVESSGRLKHLRTSVRIFKIDRSDGPDKIKLYLNRSSFSDSTEVKVYIRNGHVDDVKYESKYLTRYEKDEYEKAVGSIMDSIRR